MNEINEAQRCLDTLYARRDVVMAELDLALQAALVTPTAAGSARVEREAWTRTLTRRLSQLRAAEEGLCFGRLDRTDGTTLPVGRVGLFDDDEGHRPLLIDWRAPAAGSFYTATAQNPEGLRRRQHIASVRRRVTRVEEELLTADPGDDADDGRASPQGVLLSALAVPRTGMMRDIIGTIQAEQDRIIRQPLEGVLVVQGGPGTGKTAVALHRAAYLLYTHRELLERRGVLVVGPNPAFLRYISEVLPALGETSVVMASLGQLHPGVLGDAEESPETAEVKGRLTMVEVIAAAVADRQKAPASTLQVRVDGTVLQVEPDMCARARDRAGSVTARYNEVRPFFAASLVDQLTRQYADLLGADPYGGPNLLNDNDVVELREEVDASEDVRALLDALWPVLTPRQLLHDLYASASRIARVAPRLDQHDQNLLYRDAGAGFSPADVPLLDEAAELLGHDDRAAQAAEDRQRRARTAYARGALQILHGSRSTDLEDDEDAEVLTATDIMDADTLAERYEGEDTRTTAERAEADRSWTFGHVIVDEAQELSPMAWRLLARRCPLRSMTVVGDLDQTGRLGESQSWSETLAPLAPAQWRLEQLSVNYRTPAEVMALAAQVLRRAHPDARPPRSARTSGPPPQVRRVSPDDLVQVAGSAALEAAAGTPGQVAVIAPRPRLDHLADVLAAELTGRIRLLTPRAAKGLEFDSVIVADPHAILRDSPRGASDLYVALTRTTQDLLVLHTAPGDSCESPQPTTSGPVTRS